MTGIILTNKHDTHELFKENFFADSFVHKIKGRKFYVVKSIDGTMFVITFCGEQPYEVAACTSHLITNFNLTEVIHIGVGENRNINQNNYEVLLASSVYVMQHLAQDKKYITSESLNLMIKRILMAADLNYVEGEVFEYNSNMECHPSIACIKDLQAAPIICTCSAYEVPCAVIKINVAKDKARLCSLIDNLTYNIVQEISYQHLKDKEEKI